MSELHAWLEYQNPATQELTRVELPENEPVLIGGLATHPVTVSGRDTRFILSDPNLIPITLLNRRQISQAELTNLDEIQIGNAAYIFRAAYIEAPDFLSQPIRVSDREKEPKIKPVRNKIALNLTATTLLIGIYSSLAKADLAIAISLAVLVTTLGLLGNILLFSILQKTALPKAIEHATELAPFMIGSSVAIGILGAIFSKIPLSQALAMSFIIQTACSIIKLGKQNKRIPVSAIIAFYWTTLMAPLFLAALTTRGH